MRIIIDFSLLKQTIAFLHEDLDTYGFRKGWLRSFAWLTVFFYPACWPIIVYRYGYFVRHSVHVPILREFCLAIYFIAKRLTKILTTIEISNDAVIGKGLFIGHIGGIVISNGAHIGDYASFHQRVTVGRAGRGVLHGSPLIGNCVYFSAGCEVIVRIVVGDDVVIGANAVVVKDVPDMASVGGVPAKLLNLNGSNDFIHYTGKASSTCK